MTSGEIQGKLETVSVIHLKQKYPAVYRQWSASMMEHNKLSEKEFAEITNVTLCIVGGKIEGVAAQRQG